MRKHHIGISLLNLGYLASDYAIDTDIHEVLLATNQQLIPLQDVILAIKFILATSKATCIKEIDMPAMADLNT